MTNTTPVLNNVQRLTIIAALREWEIFQLRSELAKRDLEAAIKTVSVPGYDLRLSDLSYVPTGAASAGVESPMPVAVPAAG